MRALRRFLAALALLPGLVLLPAAPAAADDHGGPRGQDNTAVAVNTKDGASVFRLAFSVRRVADGVVDQTNAAYALASCTDCQTIALAFQVVLAFGDVDVAVPENRAVAYNDQCRECVTYASATQIVLGFDGPVRMTADGWRRLVALRRALRGLEERAPTLTVVELNAEVQAAKAELAAILEEELVEVPARRGDDDRDGQGDQDDRDERDEGDGRGGPALTTTTTADPSGATTTTAGSSPESSPTSSSSTTTTTESSSTTTTAQPTTTTVDAATGGAR